MNRPRMTEEVAEGLALMEKLYALFFDKFLGDMYHEILEVADSGLEDDKYTDVPFVKIEKSRIYLSNLNLYYKERRDKKDNEENSNACSKRCSGRS